MDNKTKGAWIVHHGRKVAADQRGAAEYSAIDLAHKTSALLARLAESNQVVLDNAQVIAAARVGGMNPKMELEASLKQLKDKRLIDITASGVEVLGITGESALTHAASLFESNDPQPIERAAIGLAELASNSPVKASQAKEYISDTYKIGSLDTADFIQQASEIGFIDSEADGEDKLLFNGNLFRRNTAQKTLKVLGSLNPEETRKFQEFEALLKTKGAVLYSQANKMLGNELLSKLQAAAVFDMNIVSNEAGEHTFITSPSSFHKFSDPLTEDAFDHAKSLVAALSYGMSVSSYGRGKILSIEALLGRLINGYKVGPATAIGNDYRALEFERVVQVIPESSGLFSLRLLKKEVGEIALEVLRGGNAAAAALEVLPSAGMKSYTAPEAARAQFRKNQSSTSKLQTRNLLSAVRGGSSL